jgi:pyruvate/2-oxoglutarate dehydrogenase complex dihydrolipoamide dehydrogenase (E3) component
MLVSKKESWWQKRLLDLILSQLITMAFLALLIQNQQVASVGLTTATAKERGYDIEEISYDLGGNGKSQILKTAGSIKIVQQKGGPVLGIHMVGDRVGERNR